MKRICLILVVLCCVCQPGFSQENTWSLGVGFSPDYCSRVLKASGDFPKEIIADRNTRESGKPGYHAGLYIKYRKNNIWEFESGLLYSNKGYLSTFEARFGDQVGPMGFTGSSTTITSLYHYKYLGVPLKVNARIVSNDRLAMHITAGARISAFLEQKTVTYGWEEAGGKSVSYDNSGDASPIDISPFLGIGIEIRLKENLHLMLEPAYSYGIVPVYPGYAVKTHLWSLGLNTVLYCRI